VWCTYADTNAHTGEVIGGEEAGLTPEEIDERLHPTMPIRMKDCQGMCCRVEIKYSEEWGTVCVCVCVCVCTSLRYL
jgi:hypothetical protein